MTKSNAGEGQAGELLPCPFCQEVINVRTYTAFHPSNNCWLSGHEIDGVEYEDWNRRSPQVGEGWQGIESAPKDGTRVDLWLDIPASPRSFGWADSFRVTDAVWRDGHWFHPYKGKDERLETDYITHWQPLPAAPPKEDEG